MNTATLLADPKAIKLDCVRPSHNAVILAIKTAARLALCPRCHRRSTRIHSRYLRHVADLPWHGVSVRLELYARRFRCRNSLCPQRIFCERLPRVVGHYTRKSVRLQAALELIGFAVGGESGARITRELGLTVSPDTLLRRLRLARAVGQTLRTRTPRRSHHGAGPQLDRGQLPRPRVRDPRGLARSHRGGRRRVRMQLGWRLAAAARQVSAC